VQTHRYYSKKSTRPTGPKYKKEYKDQMKLSPFLKQPLIGLILGDQREFSTLNSKSFRLTKLEQNQFFISPELKQILIGVSLGDLHIDKKLPTRNALLRFEQGSIHEDYLLHLMIYFNFIVDQDPNIVIVKLILEQIKYIHEFNFKLDHYLVLMNFMNYFIRMVRKSFLQIFQNI
jgi:hypothetical protein